MRRVNAEPHLLSVVQRASLPVDHVQARRRSRDRSLRSKAGTLSCYVSTSKSSSASLFQLHVQPQPPMSGDRRLAMRRALVPDLCRVWRLYRPDTFLLPVRVEVRKYFGYSHSLKSWTSPALPFTRHLSQAHALHGRDLRPAAYFIASTSRTSWSPREGPDMYYVSVPHASPQLLSEGMQQSLMLAQSSMEWAPD
jgi:hypothetical protein